jgi:hypothetical protein
MARTTRRETTAPTAIVASAKPTTIKNVRYGAAKSEGWQDAAWARFNDVAEFRSACTWVGNIMSKAKLGVAHVEADGTKTLLTSGPAYEALREFFNGPEGQSQMLYYYGVDYSVAGEAWIVGYDSPLGPVWKVYTAGEVTSEAQAYRVEVEDENPISIPADATVIRTWRAHPRYSNRADAPSQACLPVLNEIRRLTMHVEAQIDSRLAGAGILWVPNEIAVAVQVATAGDNPSSTPTATATRLVEAVQAAMAESVDNHDSAAALVPIVVTADGEHIANVKHMTFWTPLDENAIALRTEAIRRLALGLDLPPEVMTGTGGINHWGSWQIEESAIKAYTEPLLAKITHDITVGYLRPAIDGEPGITDPREYVIVADTSEMRLRPNRSQEALELFDRGALSLEALLRETGFQLSDVPDASELVTWFLKKMASGSTTPEIVVEAARQLGVNLPPALIEAPVTEARPTPSLEDHPRQDPPENAGLIAASEQMVFRALERAGNRLKTKSRVKHAGVDSSELYLFVPCSGETLDMVMEDAWTNVDRFAPQFGVNPDKLRNCLDTYCRFLITEQQPYEADRLRTYLATVTR